MNINFKQSDEQIREQWAGKRSRVQLVTPEAEREWINDTWVVLAVFVIFVILTVAAT